MREDLECKATKLYIRVKAMYIYAEETTAQFQDFLQPVFEINRGFDHLNRVKAVDLGITVVDKSEEYVVDNLNKAIGHFYRAFFDIVDWLSMNLRESVTEEFKDFSHTCIGKVMPEYYREIRPEIEEVSKEIARIRAKKDVGNPGTIALMEEYSDILEKLRAKIVKIVKKKPGLTDCEERLRKEQRNSRMWQILIALVGVTVGAALSYIFS